MTVMTDERIREVVGAAMDRWPAPDNVQRFMLKLLPDASKEGVIDLLGAAIAGTEGLVGEPTPEDLAMAAAYGFALGFGSGQAVGREERS